MVRYTRTENDFEGSGYGLIEVILRYLPVETEENHRNSVTIDCVSAEIEPMISPI
jgi:hypothetical protein